MKFLSGKFAFLGVMVMLSFLFSCSSAKKAARINKEYNYLQVGLDKIDEVKFSPLKIQPNDLISIQVSSSTMNQEQVLIFVQANNGGLLQGSANISMANSLMGYLVDEQGYITFPYLGKMKVAGKTRIELSDLIQNDLEIKGFVKAPSVQVRFLQFKVNVLGEVKSPGTKNFNSDRVTILDALGAAGDLNERGRRDNILIIREELGKQRVININLLDANFIKNDGFQLRQNDFVYVYANDIKLKETNFDPNSRFMRDLQVGSSLISVFFIVINLFLVLKK